MGRTELAEPPQTGTCAGAECAGRPGGHARAVQEATHCQRPVPEPGSRSPRSCTRSLCVGRQQSHSVTEKEACVSRSPSSERKDGLPNGPFTGHPSLPSSNQLQPPPPLDPGIPDIVTQSPHGGLATAATAANPPASEPAAVTPPSAAALWVIRRPTGWTEFIYLLGEKDEGSCGSCTF